MNKGNRIDSPLCLPIQQLKFENKETVTIQFHLPSKRIINVKPGQYFMLWKPGDDEIPISVSNYENTNRLSFTITSEGITSENFLGMSEGDFIGLRGPYGNGFDLISSGKVILVGGGIGITPLFFLAQALSKKKNTELILIQGAQSEQGLIFKEEFKKFIPNIQFCTDDGSFGFHGFPIEPLKEILENEAYSNSDIQIYACGPEKMLKRILDIVQRFGLASSTQFSIADRYIRCGFGICGSCTLDDIGLTLCHDGPIFRGDVLLKVNDFGTFGKRSDGSKYKLD